MCVGNTAQIRMVLSLPMVLVMMLCRANIAAPSALAAVVARDGMADGGMGMVDGATSKVAYDCMFATILGMLLYRVERTLQNAQSVYRRHVQELGSTRA